MAAIKMVLYLMRQIFRTVNYKSMYKYNEQIEMVHFVLTWFPFVFFFSSCSYFTFVLFDCMNWLSINRIIFRKGGIWIEFCYSYVVLERAESQVPFTEPLFSNRYTHVYSMVMRFYSLKSLTSTFTSIFSY